MQKSTATFGECLQAAREARRLSRPNVAKCLGLNPLTMRHYERGWCLPSRPVYEYMVELFGPSIDVLDAECLLDDRRTRWRRPAKAMPLPDFREAATASSARERRKIEADGREKLAVRLESIADHGPTDDLDQSLMAAACVAAAKRMRSSVSLLPPIQDVWPILAKLLIAQAPAPPGRTEVARRDEIKSPRKGAEAIAASNRENRTCSRESDK